MRGIGGDADTDGESQYFSVRQRDWLVRDGMMQTFGERKCFFRAGVRKENKEFVPPVARGQVDLAGVDQDALGDRRQDRVASRMAVSVVEAFEMVDVQDHQGQLAVRPFGTVEFFFQTLLE